VLVSCEILEGLRGTGHVSVTVTFVAEHRCVLCCREEMQHGVILLTTWHAVAFVDAMKYRSPNFSELRRQLVPRAILNVDMDTIHVYSWQAGLLSALAGLFHSSSSSVVETVPSMLQGHCDHTSQAVGV
jgi:hypothetical protein